MSEKKYLFKIAKGDSVGQEYHKIKLVGDNEQEILFHEPYLAHYEVENGVLRYSVENDKNNITTSNINIDNAVAEIIRDNNCQYHLSLYKDENEKKNGNGIVIPFSSLELKVDHTQMDDYTRKSLDLDWYYPDDGVRKPRALIKGKDGVTICTLESRALAMKGNTLYTFGTEAVINFQYVTIIENYKGDDRYFFSYFSDEEGYPVDWKNTSYGELICRDALEYWTANPWNVTLEIALRGSNLPDVISTQHTFEVLAGDLTDAQLQTLINHLTNHQLETLAQELNETKLKIIVPTLNEDQLGSLVRGLEPDQVKNLLPHLKMDQFKAFITSLDSEQFTVIVKDLAEHHLTILSKELGVDQLRALVSSLQEDQLKDLVNKLDDRQLVAIAQDLTDPSRIKVIIDSLIDPEKLQILAQNMSDEQFAKLLNELSPKDLKDIIHKLPYEKVISVVGNLGSKDQSNAIIEMLKEKLGEQSEKLKEILDKVDQMRPEESEKIFESVPNISPQDSNAELMEAMTYVQYQPEYL